jgi:hypothetical protein
MRRRELLWGSFCAHSLRTFSFILAALALAICFSGRATAQLPVGPQLNPANGHYYETVRYLSGASVDRTFSTALAAASAKSHNGIPGHLVTITSSEEQVFLETTFWPALADRGWWMGASDAAVEGEWRWITGPEAGQLFWKTDAIVQGSPVGTALGFESWLRDDTIGTYWEPNNQANAAGEDYATLAWRPGPPVRPLPDWAGPYYRTVYWNDLFGVDGSSSQLLSSWVKGYVVEYSVPEPASAWLALLGVAWVSRAARRRLAAA